MTVRQSLLAILDQGPCYGYQLRAEFDRRTGSTWPLNVGQIYNTLDRLERDGLVAKGETDEQGHVYYEITDAGSLEVAAWLSSPVVACAGHPGRARHQARRRGHAARRRRHRADPRAARRIAGEPRSPHAASTLDRRDRAGGCWPGRWSPMP